MTNSELLTKYTTSITSFALGGKTEDWNKAEKYAVQILDRMNKGQSKDIIGDYFQELNANLDR